MAAGKLRLYWSDARAVCTAARRICSRCITWFAASARRSRERSALARLDKRLLKDIGVSRFDAMREANKPFWR